MIQGKQLADFFFGHSNSASVSSQNLTNQCPFKNTTTPNFHFPCFNLNSVFSVTNGVDRVLDFTITSIYCLISFVKTKCSIAPVILLSTLRKVTFKINIWDSLNDVENSTWTFNDCLCTWLGDDAKITLAASIVQPILDVKSGGVCRAKL